MFFYFRNSNQNILTCLNSWTGTPFYTRQRLDGIEGLYASPVAARGQLYIAGRNGTTLVLRHGPKYEVLASSSLSEKFEASPVIVGNELYLRRHRAVYCVAAEWTRRTRASRMTAIEIRGCVAAGGAYFGRC